MIGMKNMKIILLLTIGIVIGGAIGIKASTLISSSQVIYKDNKTVEGTLDELFITLNNGKEKVAEAITAKGVATTSDNTLEEMASNISNIQSSVGGYTKVARGTFSVYTTSSTDYAGAKSIDISSYGFTTTPDVFAIDRTTNLIPIYYNKNASSKNNIELIFTNKAYANSTIEWIALGN